MSELETLMYSYSQHSTIVRDSSSILSVGMRLFYNLGLDDDKVQKHVDQESEVHRRTGVKQNVQTEIIYFTPMKKKNYIFRLTHINSSEDQKLTSFI